MCLWVCVCVSCECRSPFSSFPLPTLYLPIILLLCIGLLNEFRVIQKRYHLPMGDFPHPGRFRDTLKHFQISNFPKLNKKSIEKLDSMLSTDIPVAPLTHTQHTLHTHSHES